MEDQDSATAATLPMEVGRPLEGNAGAGMLQVKGFYEGGGVALEVVSARGVEYTATVNLEDYPLPKGEAWLKNWGGQEGTPEALQAAGAVRLTGRTQETGWVEAQHAELLFEPPEPIGDDRAWDDLRTFDEVAALFGKPIELRKAGA